MIRPTRRQMIHSSLAGLGAMATRADARSSTAEKSASFHYDHVLGTSLDVWTVGGGRSVDRIEDLVLTEIERLRRIFSTFDPDSELSRLNRTRGPFRASADLIAVLRLYDTWQRRTRGAFSAQLGELTAEWRRAGRTGENPTDATLKNLARNLRQPGWSIDEVLGTVTRLHDQPLNLNSAAKGYIIQSATKMVRDNVPDLSGILLNLGGDMTAIGAWLIAIQDPFRPEENSRPLSLLRLQNAAMATSGGYQRYVTIGDERHSHLIDPRTGRPAGAIASATVVAPDSITANILATTLCVLKPIEGLELIRSLPNTDSLVVVPRGEQFRSDRFASMEPPTFGDGPVEKKAPAKDDMKDWPADFRVAINVELPQISGGKYRRPYVAVWIEDSAGKPVRSVSVWGNDKKWLRELSTWWKIGGTDANLVKAVTRATRAPGKYEVVWDGKDDMGNTVPQGTYTVKVEVHREHGKHLYQSGKINCGAQPARTTLEKNAETGATVVDYGKKK